MNDYDRGIIKDISQRVASMAMMINLVLIFLCLLIVVLTIIFSGQAFRADEAKPPMLYIPLPIAEDEIDINRLIRIESSGNPQAVSINDCRGLMQLSAAAWADVQRFYPELKKYAYEPCWANPEINILFGSKYLKIIRDRYLKGAGDVSDILICYNFGYGNWKKWERGEISLPRETSNYLKKYFSGR